MIISLRNETALNPLIRHPLVSCASPRIAKGCNLTRNAWEHHSWRWLHRVEKLSRTLSGEISRQEETGIQTIPTCRYRSLWTACWCWVPRARRSHREFQIEYRDVADEPARYSSDYLFTLGCYLHSSQPPLGNRFSILFDTTCADKPGLQLKLLFIGHITLVSSCRT